MHIPMEKYREKITPVLKQNLEGLHTKRLGRKLVQHYALRTVNKIRSELLNYVGKTITKS